MKTYLFVTSTEKFWLHWLHIVHNIKYVTFAVLQFSTEDETDDKKDHWYQKYWMLSSWLLKRDSWTGQRSISSEFGKYSGIMNEKQSIFSVRLAQLHVYIKAKIHSLVLYIKIFTSFSYVFYYCESDSLHVLSPRVILFHSAVASTSRTYYKRNT